MLEFGHSSTGIKGAAFLPGSEISTLAPLAIKTKNATPFPLVRLESTMPSMNHVITTKGDLLDAIVDDGNSVIALVSQHIN